MKIVNGEVVREGGGGGGGGGERGAASEEGPPGTITVFGNPFQRWHLGAIIFAAFLFMGIRGAFLSSIVLGGGYLYSNSASRGSGSNMQRMGVRSSGGNGANIKGMKDLPPPPKSS